MKYQTVLISWALPVESALEVCRCNGIAAALLSRAAGTVFHQRAAVYLSGDTSGLSR